MKNKKENICECICHIKDNEIIHIKPCCKRTYEKYINEDRTIDYNKL